MIGYEVQIDVIMSGTVYITADNEDQARVIAGNMRFVPSDLRNFYQVNIEVIDINREDN